jgi:hypothetical protein
MGTKAAAALRGEIPREEASRIATEKRYFG